MSNPSPEPNPGYRIGDAERDRAVERLRESHVEGRLDASEFDERMQRALGARTQGDLEALFTDLPADRGLAVPDAAPAPAPREPESRSGMARAVGALSGIAWPAAIIANFATDWRYWWIILIPALLMPALLGALRRGGHYEHRRD